MSLSREPVLSLLRNRFVCGYKDIVKEGYAGDSGRHKPNETAVDTTNGAGPHNIQLFVLAPDGTVLHCLPGYWNSTDLAFELEFAERLNRIWNDHTLSRSQKNDLFAKSQKDHIRLHSPEMTDRSRMQHFDVAVEVEKRGDSVNERADRDAAPEERVKTTDCLLHERMARRPFAQYNSFDVAAYSNYGSHFYDKNESNLDEDGKVMSHGGMRTMRQGDGPLRRSKEQQDD